MVTICELAYSATSFARIKAFRRLVSDKSGCLVLILLMKAALQLGSLSCFIFLPERSRLMLLVAAQGANCLYSSVDQAHLSARSSQQASNP